ncbi:MAG TPA: hypothetical protein VJ385_07050 [Fibrobacteria bacterium]|nr:hypothetical protein [Fibrobacteria bacterium]
MFHALILALFLCLTCSSAVAATGPIGGFAMPSVEDEKTTYRAHGMTWSAAAEPNYASAKGFSVGDPDIHGDTEGDDLWTYLMMYLRSNQKGYLERADAWARYHMNQYVKCQGQEDRTLCYDESAFLLCHIYGWGLLAWYEYSGDAKALEAAEALGDRLDKFLSTSSNKAYPVPGQKAMNYYGPRGPARHLHLITRLAEVTGKKRWIDLRDLLINLWMKSPDWDGKGMYFVGDWQTDYKLGEGSYAAGIRIMPSFQLGVLTEAFAQAYRTTQDPRIKEKMIAMARFVEKYGLDPKYEYTGSHFGLKNGVIYHDYSAKTTVDFWDPAYTTSLVNTLVWGYKLTGDKALLDKAFHYYDRGNKGIYGEAVKRSGVDGQIHHFADSRFSSASENQYLDYNKGELQYTWALFDQNKPGAIRPQQINTRFPGLNMSMQPGRIVFSGPGLDGVRSACITDVRGNVISMLGGPSTRAPEARQELGWNPESAPFGMFLLSVQDKHGTRVQPFIRAK